MDNNNSPASRKRHPYLSYCSNSQINLETQHSNQTQLVYVHPLNNNGERHQLTDSSESSDTIISNPQSIYDIILPNHFMPQPLGFSLTQGELNSLESNESSFTNTEHITSYPLLLDLLNYRDSLCDNKDLTELLFRTKKLSVELDKASHIDMTEDIRSCISTVIHQMVETCNKEMEVGDEILKFYGEHREKQLNNDYLIGQKDDGEEKKKTTRQNMNPMAVLWFIKYLIDHNLEKPSKKHRHLLSLWTSVPEHDIDRWFIRTMSNYVKKLNDVEKSRDKLNDRAINTTRQLRKPNSLNSLRTSSETRQRNLPYQRPPRDKS